MTRTSHSPKRARSAARRGSALLLVLGTLALIAVFAAVYLAIGRADRRAAAAVEQRGEVERSSEAVAGHIAGVIGADRLNVFPQTLPLDPVLGNATSLGQGAYRETTDIPITDWTRRSQWEDRDYATSPFTLRGGHTRLYREGLFGVSETDILSDARIADDPWLASTRPEYLGPDDAYFASPSAGGRVFSSSATNTFDPTLAWLDNRDWRQISNLAPDGRFANLFWLRPQADPYGRNVYGGFDAAPGIGTYQGTDGRTRARTTYSLTQLRLERDTDPTSALVVFDPAETGEVWLSGAGEPVPLNNIFPGQTVDPLNVPAIWTMYQRYLFFPAGQPFYVLDRDGQLATWASPDYPDYQYADADGDGFYDSRWAELLDTSDPRSIVNLLDTDIGRSRVFFAARVVDLSSMVNVLTATDSLVPPSDEEPLGSTPAEVDLRRLLTMSDFAVEYGVGLSLLDNYGIRRGDPAGDYRGYAATGNLTDQTVGLYVPGSHDPYALYATDDDGNLMPDGAETLTIAEELGRVGYDALRLALTTRPSLGSQVRGPYFDPYNAPDVPLDPTADSLALMTGSRFELAYDRMTGQWGADTDEDDQAERRAAYYRTAGVLDPDASGRLAPESPVMLNADTVAFAPPLFTIDDLGELLVYHGINDDQTTSRLELTFRGRGVVGRVRPRGPAPTGQRLRTDRLDPLLSSRPTELDRLGAGDGRIDGLDPFRQLATVAAYPSVLGSIDEEAMLLSNISPRLYLTTHSGATPLRSQRVSVNETAGIPEGLDNGEARSGIPSNAQALFGIYRAALSPDAGLRNDPDDPFALDYGPANTIIDPTAWDANQTRFASLSYGYAGPEFALRLAAHLAVNAADMLDGADSEPTAATLIVDNSVRQAFDQAIDAERPWEMAFPWFMTTPLDAGNARLAGEGDADTAGTAQLPELDPVDNLNAGRQAVNVFGFEAHPIITEVATIALYSDAPVAAGGDREWDGGTGYENPREYVRDNLEYWLSPPAGEAGDPPPPDQPITISGVLPAVPQTDTMAVSANPDLMLHVLVFQLHNPYDRPITLGVQGGTDADRENNPEWSSSLTRGATMYDDRADRPGLEHPFNFYIEYAGRFFKLGQFIRGADDFTTTDDRGDHVLVTDPNWRYRTVTLAAGQTRNFYVLAHDEGMFTDSDDFHTLNQRWRAVIQAYSGQTDLGRFGTVDPQIDGDEEDDDNANLNRYNNNDGYRDDNEFTGPVEEWLMGQLTVNGALPVRIKEFDPATGEVYLPDPADVTQALGAPDDAVVRDLTVQTTAPLFGDTRVSTNVARLWRKMEISGQEALGPNNLGSLGNQALENYVANDLLVDRLIGLTPFAGKMPFSGGPIDGTLAWEEALPLENDPCGNSDRTIDQEEEASVRQDNTGWTIARWMSARRVITPQPAGEVLSPWLIQARFGTGDATITRVNGTDSFIQIDPDDLDGYAKICGPTDLRVGGRPKKVWDRVKFRNGQNGFYDVETQRSLLDMFSLSFGGEPRDFEGGAGSSLFAYRTNPDEAPDRIEIVRTLAYPPADKRRAQSGVAWDSENGTRFKFELEGTGSTFRNLANTEIEDSGDITYTTTEDRGGRLSPILYEGPITGRRPADLLLAWGVGPVHAPEPGSDRTNLNMDFDPDAEWITGSEMIAMALGFEAPSIADSPTDNFGASIDDIYVYLFNENAANDAQANAADAYALDSGRLRLDAFVPFLNRDLSTDIVFGDIYRPVYASAAYVGNTFRRLDIPTGQGLPLAMGVVDRVTGNTDAMENSLPPLTLPEPLAGEGAVQYASRLRSLLTAAEHPMAIHLPGVTSTSESASGYRNRVQSQWDQLEPLLRIARGRININTAPLHVMRMLPGVSPLPEYRQLSYDGGDRGNIFDTVMDEWAEGFARLDGSKRAREFGMLSRDPLEFVASTDLATAGEFALPDFAATLVGYRDRTRVPLRALSDPYRLVNGVATPFGYEPIGDRAAHSGTNFVFDVGRATSTGHDERFDTSGFVLPSALRGEYGFRSQAEILAAVYRQSDDPDTTLYDEREVFDRVRASLATAYGIDGDDTEPIGVAGADIRLVTEDYGSGSNEVADDYDERLAMANAVLNSIDVRSDIFAVWFVVHVYTESDVEGLQAEDPLVPSTARRYLMVIDRSGVVGPEDKPRILTMREIPL